MERRSESIIATVATSKNVTIGGGEKNSPSSTTPIAERYDVKDASGYAASPKPLSLLNDEDEGGEGDGAKEKSVVVPPPSSTTASAALMGENDTGNVASPADIVDKPAAIVGATTTSPATKTTTDGKSESSSPALTPTAASEAPAAAERKPTRYEKFVSSFNAALNLTAEGMNNFYYYRHQNKIRINYSPTLRG